MNRTLSPEEIKHIEEDFTEEEFNNLIAKINTKKREEVAKKDVERLINFVRQQGGSRIARVQDNDNPIKRSIIYDYESRKDIKIRFETKSYGESRPTLSTRMYSFSADSIDNLMERLPYIHQGIKDKII